jgi:hypothetical protein
MENIKSALEKGGTLSEDVERRGDHDFTGKIQ